MDQPEKRKSTNKIHEIATLLFSEDEFDREELIRTLCQAYFSTNSRSDRNVARMILRASLADPAWSVRNLAVEYFEEVGTQTDIFALKSCRDDPQWVVRASVYSTLGAICGARHAHLIIHGFSDPEPVVRRYAYVGLSTLLGESAVPILLCHVEYEMDDLAKVGLFAALCECGEMQFVDELENFANSDWPRISSPAIEQLNELIQAFEENK